MANSLIVVHAVNSLLATHVVNSLLTPCGEFTTRAICAVNSPLALHVVNSPLRFCEIAFYSPLNSQLSSPTKLLLSSRAGGASHSYGEKRLRQPPMPRRIVWPGSVDGAIPS